ncbi:hypothetical protein BASA50_000851 [Batrachochytrium salamandrivorans]|uniref:Uncharacterized protein n=1 Tax=Batrachochytrium salamandrivorans TaxID=1357716 RepID=A0ABQ8ET22_9FUNG|nr:hypothetical protein BASA50_000851 [Batrachochytrium salamandrivorans]
MIGSLVVMARLDEASQTPLQFLFNSALATKRGSSQQNPHKKQDDPSEKSHFLEHATERKCSRYDQADHNSRTLSSL